MLKTGLMKWLLVASLVLPVVVFAETGDIKEYKVVKGDTLWGISGKELKDPFLWPKIWKENPSISDPDRLQPGQIVKIPLYLLQKEKHEEETAQQPQERKEAPKVTEVIMKEAPPGRRPLVNRDTLIASGYIGDTVPYVGTVGDSPSGKKLFGNGDVVYLTIQRPAKVGDKFYIIYASDEVRHPVTGRKMGHAIGIIGIAEIIKADDVETIAKITKCFAEIHQGDLLDSYYEIEPPMTDGHFRRPDINGTIVATSNESIMQSKLDVVFIDKGCLDGIQIGDMFRTIAVDVHAVPNGVIQVIACRDHTATVLIENSSNPVVPGNIFAKMAAD